MREIVLLAVINKQTGINNQRPSCLSQSPLSLALIDFSPYWSLLSASKLLPVADPLHMLFPQLATLFLPFPVTG